LLAADDDALDDRLLLHVAAGDHTLHAANDDIAEARVPLTATAEHLEAHDFLGARVVGHVQPGLHLDHGRDDSNRITCVLVRQAMFYDTATYLLDFSAS